MNLQFVFDDAAKEEIFLELEKTWCSGLTLSGGDPLFPDSRETIAELVKEVREKYPNKTIWCYTGFDFERDVMGTMAKNSEITRELLKYIDVVVDGKFEEDKKDLKLQFRGSSNQRIIDVPETIKTGKIIKEEQYR